LPIAQAKTVQILEQVRTSGVRLIATSSHKGVPLPQANLALPLAVLVGGEGAGISKDLLARADEIVGIPHAPQVESLNAGVAASIVLYEIAKKH
jgi:tRNA G18 (ribose-2'-O)-methylase SpoU